LLPGRLRRRAAGEAGSSSALGSRIPPACRGTAPPPRTPSSTRDGPVAQRGCRVDGQSWSRSANPSTVRVARAAGDLA
jgi:hypothetical protein